MAAADNKERMGRILDGLARGDAALFLESLDEAFTWRIIGSTPWSRTYNGKAAVRRELLAPLFAQFATPYRNVASLIVAEGDVVVVECRGETTTHGGEAYHNEYCWVCRWADGKLVSLTEYMDTALVERVLRAPG